MSIADLIDDRVGVVTAAARQPADPRMPSAWVAWGATMSRIDRVAPWRADGFGFGASLGDDDAARGAAVGEAIERYCGNAVPAATTVASWNELVRSGHDAIDPETLALFSPQQYATQGFPFQPFTRSVRTGWVSGEDLVNGGSVWAPMSLVYLDTRHGAGLALPPLHSLSYAGIAAGPDRRSAERNALEELIERDACTVWWRSGATTRRIADEGLVLAQLGRPGAGASLEIRLLHMPSDLPAPVIAAFIEQGGEFVAFGAACRSTPEAAATKALVEAIGLLQVTRQLADPGSEVWRAVDAEHIPRHVYLPFRADRRYRDDAGDEFRTLADLPPIAQLFLDRRMQGAPLERLRPTASVRFAELPRVDSDEPRDRYVEELSASGHRVVSFDLTTRDVRAAGLSVVRVLVPGLVGNAPPAFPLSGSPRLLSVPRRLGWDVQPDSVDDLVTVPLPLA